MDFANKLLASLCGTVRQTMIKDPDGAVQRVVAFAVIVNHVTLLFNHLLFIMNPLVLSSASDSCEVTFSITLSKGTIFLPH